MAPAAWPARAPRTTFQARAPGGQAVKTVTRAGRAAPPLNARYANLADRYGGTWLGRRYDRANPSATEPPNQALNHASSAVEAAAAIAVAATATIPQLGFVHEDPGQSFVLDIADLFHDTVTIPCAFRAAAGVAKRPHENLERTVRRLTGETLRREKTIDKMIGRIKALFEDPAGTNAEGSG